MSAATVVVLVAAAALLLEPEQQPAAVQPAGGEQAQAFRPTSPAAPVGKPVAPFSMDAELEGQPVVGLALDIRITLHAQAPLENVELRIGADSGLALDASDATLTALSAAPGAPVEWRITVVALEEGVHRLRLFAEASVDGARQGRSVVVPVRVGTGEGVKTDSAVRSNEPSPAERRNEPAEATAEPGESGDTSPERMIRLPATQRP